MTPLLKLQGLHLQLPTKSGSRTILRDVSLAVGESEAVGLVGESGAGKSMLAKSVMRMLPAGASVHGSVLFDGQEVHQLTDSRLEDYRRGGASLIPQDPRAAINPVHSVGDFLMEPLITVAGLTRAEALRQAQRALADVAIDNPSHVLDQYPYELSGGMLQRVMICSALLSNSRLIVADEPTTALDATTQADVMAILIDLRRSRGLALLFITHDLELATAVCDRIAVMYAGQIVEQQPTSTLAESARHPYTHALFAARPRVESSRQQLAAIPGRPAAAYEVDDHSCSFASRCSRVEPDCLTTQPDLAIAEGVLVRCIHPLPIAPTSIDPVRRKAVQGAAVTAVRSGPPALSVAGLRKVYPPRGRGPAGRGGGGLVAVNEVSFDLPSGGCVAIVGQSGSGKSTLAGMIAGLLKPTAGTVHFQEPHPARSWPAPRRRAAARNVQMVFQNPYSSLDPRQSGEQCLTEMLKVHFDLSATQRGDRIAELGELVGLGLRDLQVLPRHLSGGQRQRLAIARALTLQPTVLILDEAVSALDVSVQAQILNVLIDIRRELGLSYVFVSHDLAVVRQISETVLVMRRGHVVETGDTGKVLDNPQHPYTQLLRASVPRKGWVPERRSTVKPTSGEPS